MVSHNIGANITAMYQAIPDTLARNLSYMSFSKQLHRVAIIAEHQLQMGLDTWLLRCSSLVPQPKQLVHSLSCS